jgi:hypothetical protein
LLDAVQHLLEQNPFVRRVLVEQHESAVGFQQHIKPADDADEPERDVEQRRGRGRRRWDWELRKTSADFADVRGSGNFGFWICDLNRRIADGNCRRKAHFQRRL